MSAGLTPFTVGLLGVCIATESLKHLCFKRAAHDASVIAAMVDPYTIGGILLWVVELVAWLRVLETVPLGIAFPCMALVYALVVMGGAVFLREPVDRRHALGSFFIMAGVACIGATGLGL